MGSKLCLRLKQDGTRCGYTLRELADGTFICAENHRWYASGNPMDSSFICSICSDLVENILDMRYRDWKKKNGTQIRQICCKYCTIVPPCPEKESGIHSEIWVADEDLYARDMTEGLFPEIPAHQIGICSDCKEVHIWSTDKGRWLTVPELGYRVVL